MWSNVRNETANDRVPRNSFPSAKNGHYLTARALVPQDKEPKFLALEAFPERRQLNALENDNS